jgi:hypothetical protein
MQKPWIKFAVITAAFIIGLLSIVITKKHDNVIEQAAEVVLQAEGITVDLSKE